MPRGVRGWEYSQSLWVYTTLNVAEQQKAAGVVVREVTQGLQRITPLGTGEEHPPVIAIKLSEVLYERLDQALVAIFRAGPDLRDVKHDGQVEDPHGVPGVDELLGSSYHPHLDVEVIREEGARDECLGDTCFSFARSDGVVAAPDFLESTLGEWTSTPWKKGEVGLVGS